MQLRHRRCVERTVSGQFVPNREVTGPTPSLSPGQTESEEDDDITDPNWTLPEVPEAPSNGYTNPTPRKTRGRPRKNCSDPKEAHKNSTSEPVKDSCSIRLPKNDNLKTEQSASRLKSGTPRTAVCKICHKAFLTKRDLQRHEHTHTGAKPFKCSVCERGFNDLGNMHKHMAVHWCPALQL